MYESVEARLAKHSIPEPNSGCWIWTAWTHRRSGYGVIGVQGKNKYAHRVSYELFKGPIPSGLELDHLCRVRCCINPDHLEPVTRSENVRRGLAPLVNGADHRAKTHCIYGHPFDENNTYWDKKGHRICRACHCRWTAEYNARKNKKQESVS